MAVILVTNGVSSQFLLSRSSYLIPNLVMLLETERALMRKGDWGVGISFSGQFILIGFIFVS